MCLIVLAWRVHPSFPLVVAANRDEFHARPAAAVSFWGDRPGILADSPRSRTTGVLASRGRLNRAARWYRAFSPMARRQQNT